MARATTTCTSRTRSAWSSASKPPTNSSACGSIRTRPTQSRAGTRARTCTGCSRRGSRETSSADRPRRLDPDQPVQLSRQVDRGGAGREHEALRAAAVGHAARRAHDGVHHRVHAGGAPVRRARRQALAARALRLQAPRRGGRAPDAAAPVPPPVSAARPGNRPYLLTVLGYAAYTFAIGALAFWTPSFLERARGIPKAQATVQFGAIVVVTGFIGTYAGGWIGDYFLRASRQAYLWVSGVVTLVAAPLTFVALAAPQAAVYWAAIVAAELCLFASTGPINSAIVNVVSPHMRATAVALSIFTIHLLGDVPSPSLVGALSDARSLGDAVLIIPLAVLAGGLIWTYAAWRGGRAGGEPSP